MPIRAALYVESAGHESMNPLRHIRDSAEFLGGYQTFYLYVMILWYIVSLSTEMTLLSPIHLYKYSTNVCVEGKPC